MPDNQSLPPVDMATFKPLGATTEPTAAPQAAGNNLPPVDMSTFKPLSGEPETVAQKPQPGIGEQIAQGFGSAAATGLTGLAKIGSHIPGVPAIAGKVGDVLGLPKLNPAGPSPYDTVQKSTEQAAQQAQSTWAGKGGALLETAAEFAVGEEALKGLSQVEQIGRASC